MRAESGAKRSFRAQKAHFCAKNDHFDAHFTPFERLRDPKTA